MKKIFKTTIGGREFRVEIGEVAKQALGSALVYYGDTAVLSVVTSKEDDMDRDFFPLMVIYQERLYAGGKIPGGFLRREGRPTENETLTSRLIDRPLRPLFPAGFHDDVQVVNTVLSNNEDNTSEMASLIGSSIVLSISNLPFEGPVAGVVVGRVNNKLIINPTPAELEVSDIDLTVAGTKEAINMVEAGAKEVSEADMLEAILFGHEEIKKIIAFQEEIVNELKPTKLEVQPKEVDQKLVDEINKLAYQKISKALVTFEKKARDEAIKAVKEEVFTKYESTKEFDQLKESEQVKYHKLLDSILEDIISVEFRRLITKDKVRPDGRKASEIRPLSSRVDVLPRTHGSALFTRGQTQSLGVVTLGALAEAQIIDDLGVEDSKRFILHYNFPPFSVGETGRYGSPGRREIGHGALARRAIEQVLPNEDEFPYTIRVVSEILESNGSSSMASVCSGTMSLMAAGVPLKKPVAGIAMGLIKEGDDYIILSDIQGLEDHLGDMDFKVTGTDSGITALQMDIKISGINRAILEEALEAAKVGRLHILSHMLETIPAVREELSDYAPKVVMIRINPEKIKDVIGAGGKIITQIIEDNNDVSIDIEQDGRVYIMHQDRKWINSTVKKIEDLVREVEVGQIYEGVVKRIEAYGAFVELWPGTEGLVHISKIAKERIEKVESVLSLGDQILVKCIGVDDKGRIDLSRKDALK